MKSTRHCVECGRQFTPSHYLKHRPQKFCSRECSAKARTKPPRSCGVCGSLFKGKSPKSKYCSRTCSGKSQRSQEPRTPVQLQFPDPRPECVICGKNYKAQSHQSHCCSIACRKVRLSRLRERKCLYCGVRFDPGPSRGKIRRYCSRHCSIRAMLIQQFGPDCLKPLAVQCSFCGKEFKPTARTSKFCSYPCYWKSMEGVDVPEGRVTAWGHAGLRGIRRDLYRQQKGRCAYCGDFMAFRETQLDHIVSLSRGGTNDHENFAIACAPCNYSKNYHTLSEWLSSGVPRAMVIVERRKEALTALHAAFSSSLKVWR